jgi:hypothetical protein
MWPSNSMGVKMKTAVKGSKTMVVKLIDMNPDTDLQHTNKGMMIEPSQKVKIEATCQGIAIRPEGYGEKTMEDGYGSPILIEQCKGSIRVIIWGDINSDEPTHIIKVDGAKEENRDEKD